MYRVYSSQTFSTTKHKYVKFTNIDKCLLSSVICEVKDLLQKNVITSS